MILAQTEARQVAVVGGDRCAAHSGQSAARPEPLIRQAIRQIEQSSAIGKRTERSPAIGVETNCRRRGS